MKTFICSLCLLLFALFNLEAYMTHQKAPIDYEWKEENLNSFNELMVSWNAARPVEGKFLFYISVKVEEWSPWLLYASWGSEGQSSFLSTAHGLPIKIHQDILAILEGKEASGFQIKIITEGNCHLDHIHGLHVYTHSDKTKEAQPLDPCLSSIYLPVPGLSQMTVDHIRHRDLCSPTSTTAVTRYLLNDYTIDPADFAQKAWDSGFDLFGNWIFNIAQASTYLGAEWSCWVERFNGFHDIYQHLQQGSPVIVSVRGSLPGSAQPYAKGHLLAVIGYDSLTQKVICMDPAFPTDSETHVSYELVDFVQAWNRRGKVAYVFSKSNENLGKQASKV